MNVDNAHNGNTQAKEINGSFGLVFLEFVLIGVSIWFYSNSWILGIIVPTIIICIAITKNASKAIPPLAAIAWMRAGYLIGNYFGTIETGMVIGLLFIPISYWLHSRAIEVFYDL